MAVVLAFKATTGSPFAPVTAANAFKGQSIGSGDMLVAEAPQSIGRVATISFTPPIGQSLAYGGFSTKGVTAHESAQSRTDQVATNQTRWDEDRVIDGSINVAAVTEKSSITEAAPASKPVTAEKSAKAKLAAAVYEDAKPRKKKSAANNSDDKPEKSAKSKSANKSERSRRSRREVAEYDERRGRSYRGEGEYKPRVAYSERSYGGGGYGSDGGGRSAGQTMSDNLRPL
jgi:hypothetical protein